MHAREYFHDKIVPIKLNLIILYLIILSVGLLSIYLSVQHLGANLTDIHEYTKKSDCSYTKEEVENVLVRNKQLFSNTADLWRFKLFFQ